MARVNMIIRFFLLLLLTTCFVHSSEPTAKQFLRYIYGADGIEYTNVCQPSDDGWMLRGPKNTNALNTIATLTMPETTSGVISGVVGRDLYFIDVRAGKVDPAFSLAGIYTLHRQLVLGFVYAALSHDKQMLGRLTTDPTRVKILGPKPPPGEMAQYASVIEAIPVVRSSNPSDDAKTKTVTYRVPLGEQGLSLTLSKQGSIWKIDTAKAVQVPLEFFFR